MSSSRHHELLLHELRTRTVRDPEIAPDATHSGEVSLLTKLDMMVPLILGAWRCTMLRAAGAIVIGCLVATTASFRLLYVNSMLNVLYFVVGLLMVLCGVFDVIPRSTPFLHVKTRAGFYGMLQRKFRRRNESIQRAMQAWEASYCASPWSRTGEWDTLLPFVMNPNRAEGMPYERVWVEASDGERVAADWVFPASGFDPSQPIVLLLTGLAPDTHWTRAGGFVADAVCHLTQRSKWTVVVLVARGTMDTRVKKNTFHGARVSDLRGVLLMMEKSINNALSSDTMSPPPIFGAGYSMGAIILANYCGQYGGDTKLRGAIHFSGIYDPVQNMKFEYSVQSWQPYLAIGLKTTYCTGEGRIEAKQRGVNVEKVLSRHCASIIDYDTEFVAVFNNYKSVEDYYRDMGLAFQEKWKNVAIPLLAVAARDDPITHCDCLMAEEFSSQNENLLFMITESGGHCGWPWGLKPWERGFEFMSGGISVFVESVLSAAKD